jgi:formylglycine-generating enzyme required for sulfatase activity
VKKYSILFAIFILAIVLIAGCGGGGGSTGVVPNNVTTNPADPTPTPGTLVQVPGNPTNPSNPTLPSNLPTGTFKVEVKFPGAGAGADMKELLGSDLPYNSHTLKVTITGEAIATSIAGQRNDLDPTGAGTYTLTVPNVPVGLNTATIEVLDPGGNLLCQRKHGFYMTPGATEGPGLILLGVAIQGDGSYIPVNIDIPQGSSISFQNHDYTNDRTASMNSGALTVGPIGHATHITQPVTAEVFPAENHLFNSIGEFDYDGQSGRVLVYGLPTLTSVTPDKDSTNGTTDVGFTLTGTNFGTAQAGVNGEVRFIQVNEGDPGNPWGTVYNPSSFTSWGNSSIVGSISLPEGKYRIEVGVRGENTTETVFFYKGTGTYQVIVGEPVEMVLIPAGTFQMGDPNGGIGYDWERPRHSVTITHNFYMSKYEIRNKEYILYESNHAGTWTDPNYPVETVNWYDAVNYCNWLSDQTGRERCYDGSYNVDITKKGYRLPTEAEWEYACRAGETVFHNYYWDGMNPNTIDSYCWYNVNSGGHPNIVGTKLANNFGLFDMSGSVWEWCNDRYGNYSGTAQTDPIGPGSGSGRVLKGGSWDIAQYCRSVSRNNFDPSSYLNCFGFRPVRTK